GGLAQLGRVGGPQGEQVADREYAVAPGPGEAHAPPHSWVVHRGVSGGRIEHDEAHHLAVAARLPGAAEPVAVTPAVGDAGGAGQPPPAVVLEHVHLVTPPARTAGTRPPAPRPPRRSPCRCARPSA